MCSWWRCGWFICFRCSLAVSSGDPRGRGKASPSQAAPRQVSNPLTPLWLHSGCFFFFYSYLVYPHACDAPAWGEWDWVKMALVWGGPTKRLEWTAADTGHRECHACCVRSSFFVLLVLRQLSLLSEVSLCLFSLAAQTSQRGSTWWVKYETKKFMINGCDLFTV